MTPHLTYSRSKKTRWLRMQDIRPLIARVRKLELIAARVPKLEQQVLQLKQMARVSAFFLFTLPIVAQLPMPAAAPAETNEPYAPPLWSKGIGWIYTASSNSFWTVTCSNSFTNNRVILSGLSGVTNVFFPCPVGTNWWTIQNYTTLTGTNLTNFGAVFRTNWNYQPAFWSREVDLTNGVEDASSVRVYTNRWTGIGMVQIKKKITGQTILVPQ